MAAVFLRVEPKSFARPQDAQDLPYPNTRPHLLCPSNPGLLADPPGHWAHSLLWSLHLWFPWPGPSPHDHLWLTALCPSTLCSNESLPVRSFLTSHIKLYPNLPTLLTPPLWLIYLLITYRYVTSSIYFICLSCLLSGRELEARKGEWLIRVCIGSQGQSWSAGWACSPAHIIKARGSEAVHSPADLWAPDISPLQSLCS